MAPTIVVDLSFSVSRMSLKARWMNDDGWISSSA